VRNGILRLCEVKIVFISRQSHIPPSIDICLLELSTTFPENSGFVAWVTAAFGPRLGFLEGFMKWLSGVTDNAIYPVIFLTYLQQLLPVLESGLPRL
jgi:amino acid transporter